MIDFIGGIRMCINNIYVISEKYNIDIKFADLFVDFYNDMFNKGIIQGGCHFISSMLYIILNEFGYKNVLRLGIAEVLGIKFSHSWIEFDNKKFDIAISDTNNVALNINGIIFASIDINTITDGQINYYEMKNESPDNTGEVVRNMTIGEYFIGCPWGKNFCWEYIVSFCKNHKKYLNVRRLKEKYSDQMWTLENKI